MMSSCRNTLLLVSLVALAGRLVAQGDGCNDAFLIPMGTSCAWVNGTVSGATQSIAAITCNGYTGNANDDVWYKFVATATDVTVTLTCNTSFDGVIDVRYGSCQGTSFACADIGGAGQSESVYTTGLGIGETYYVRVYDYAAGYPSNPAFTLCVWSENAIAGPANDNCPQATLITMGTTCNPVTGTVDAATMSIDPITCGTATGDANDDVWYKFVATAANAQIELTCNAYFDGVIDLRSGSCNGSSIACGDAFYVGTNEVIQASGLTVGTTYYIRIYDYEPGYPTDPSFDLCVYAGQPPAGNDLCGGAQLLTANTSSCTTVSGDVTNALDEGDSQCNGNGVMDLWYRFVAPGPTAIVRVDGSSGFDAVIEVLQGTCSNFDFVNCTDATGSGGVEEMLLNGLNAGASYLVQVYPYGGAPSTNTFTICVFSPPAFDECEAATALTMQADCVPTAGDAAGATDSFVSGDCDGESGDDDDVWYRFVAISGDVRITVDGNGTYDPVVNMRYQCPGNSLACANETGAGGTEVIEFQGITAGNTYYVQVFDAGIGQPSNTTFTVCVQDISPDAAVEDLNAPGGLWSLQRTNDPRMLTLAASRNVRSNWSVIDALGKQVSVGTVMLGPGSNTAVDLSKLAAGVYSFLVSGEGCQAAQRIVLP